MNVDRAVVVPVAIGRTIFCGVVSMSIAIAMSMSMAMVVSIIVSGHEACTDVFDCIEDRSSRRAQFLE